MTVCGVEYGVTGVPWVLLTLLTAETHRQNPVTRIISSLPQYAAQFSIVIQSRFCFMQKKSNLQNQKSHKYVQEWNWLKSKIAQLTPPPIALTL